MKVIVALLVCVVVAAGRRVGSPQRVLQCAGDTPLTLSCANANDILYVAANQVFWGRITNRLCPTDGDFQEPCMSSSAVSKIVSDCNGESTCTIATSDLHNGCPHAVSSYLQMTYRCVEPL